jgi:hypothetical protein
MGAFGVAAADDPLEPNEAHWRLVLAGQLKAEQQCTLNEVLTYQEMPLGNDKGVDGRVSCFDGREFTFSRTGERQKFTIQVCQPTVC